MTRSCSAAGPLSAAFALLLLPILLLPSAAPAQTALIHLDRDTRADLPVLRLDAVYTVATIPAAASNNDKAIIVEDSDGSSCTASGSTPVWCISDGVAWSILSGPGGGGGPADTDALPEGATNLYYTNARARAAVSAGTNLSYDSGTGVFSAATYPWASLSGVPATFPPDLSAVLETSLVDIGYETVTFSATPTFDASAYNGWKITLTGDVTSSTLSNELPGREIAWTIIQDPTGGHAFAWPPEVDSPCAVSAAADAVTLVKAWVDADGVTVTSCQVKNGPDALAFTCTAASNIPTPATGDTTVFCDSADGELKSKDSSGVVTSHEQAGGGGSVGGTGVWQTFTSATSVTINHDFNSLAYAVECLDGSNNKIEFSGYSTRTTTTATVDFDGVSLSGGCAAIPGGAPGPYVNTFSSVTSLTVLGSAHNMGCSPVVQLYDAATPRNAFDAAWDVDDPATCDIDFDFGSVAVSGKYVITSGAGAGAGGSGTVTSVGLSAPAIFSVAGSPVTTSGTLALSLVSQSQNFVWAAPSGAAGNPSFRLLVEGDLPALSAAKTTTGAFADARISASSVTQHQAALSITESQISDLAHTTALAFSAITAGTNTNALVIGTGGSLAASGSGAITATAGDSATAFFSSGTIEDARLPATMAGKTLTTAVLTTPALTLETADPTTNEGRLAWNSTTNVLMIGEAGGVDYAAQGDSSGAALGVSADSVALGADTTGNYAGSSSEGGAATTATALAANGANCAAGSAAGGVDASGAAESCLDPIVSSEIDTFAELDAIVADQTLVHSGSNIATATALAANGANCSAGNYPLGVDASGASESCTADDDVPESGDFGAGADLESTGAISAGAVTTAKVEAELKTNTISWAIADPATADSGNIQNLFQYAVTITEVNCSTDTGTMTIQLDERVLTTPNTAGTDVMTAQLVCDNNNQQTTTFTNAAIAADALLSLDVDAVASTPTQGRIHVTYTID